MYQASAPRFVHMLNNLATLLDKAQAHAEAKKLEAISLTAIVNREIPMSIKATLLAGAATALMTWAGDRKSVV